MIQSLPVENHDPTGYREDLKHAISRLENVQRSPTDERVGEAARDVLFALGRCLIYGVEPGMDVKNVVNEEVSVQAQHALCPIIGSWIASAESLAERWDQTWVEDEAFHLCQSMLELHLDTWGFELALAHLQVTLRPETRHAIGRFDRALRENRLILSTVADSTWWLETRDSIVGALRERVPWWLNESLVESNLAVMEEAYRFSPSSEQWSVIRAKHLWNSAAPEVQRTLAAEVEAAPRTNVSIVRWRSPDLELVAQLMIPRRLTEQELQLERTLFVANSADDTLAEKMNGIPFRLGAYSGTFDALGCAKIRLSDIGENYDGRLLVGQPLVDWRIEIEATKDPEVLQT